MLVFVDTDAWIAVSITKDINHDLARKKLEQLVAAKDLLLTSNYVLDETYTRIRYDAGLEAAVTFHDFLMEAIATGHLRMERVNKGIEQKAWEIFTSYRDQTFSYTDCTSFALCREIGIKRAFALDKHFLTMGLTLV